MPAPKKSVWLPFALLFVAGAVLRFQAVSWNWFMHGDVNMDTVVTVTVARDGRLFELPNMSAEADPAKSVAPPVELGQPTAQHPPVWPALGAALTMVRGAEITMAEAFWSLRLLSLIAGLALLPLSYLLGRKLLGRTEGLALLSWVAASFVLIDYSGNGSLYSLQTVLYLLWVLVACDRPLTARKTALMALIAGTAYLLNVQALVLVPASLLVIAAAEAAWKHKVRDALLLLGVVFLIALPWLIRNHLVFGNAFQGHTANHSYVYAKAGLHDKLAAHALTLQDRFSVLLGALRVWLPNNLYYAARKLFILAPVAFVFFSFSLIDQVLDRKRLRALLPILALLTFHILLSAIWPVWKFRYFVPILPLVMLLSLEAVAHLRIAEFWKRTIMGATLAAIVALGLVAHAQIPTHTFYYDGFITNDPFHSSQELQYIRDRSLAPR